MTEDQKILHVWETCLDLALESFRGGSMGIAAVVTTSTFDILSTGRNCLNETTTDSKTLGRSVVAHAEINALHALGPAGMTLRDLVLFTTVEPCPMCIGAVGMSRVTKLFIGSRDPWAGSLMELSSNPYLKRKKIECHFADQAYESYFSGLHYLGARKALQDRPKHPFVEAFNQVYGDLTRKIETGLATGSLPVDPLDKERLLAFLEPGPGNGGRDR